MSVHRGWVPWALSWRWGGGPGAAWATSPRAAATHCHPPCHTPIHTTQKIIGRCDLGGPIGHGTFRLTLININYKLHVPHLSFQSVFPCFNAPAAVRCCIAWRGSSCRQTPFPPLPCPPAPLPLPRRWMAVVEIDHCGGLGAVRRGRRRSAAWPPPWTAS